MSDITIHLSPEQREQFTTLREGLLEQANDHRRQMSALSVELNGLLAQANLVTMLLVEPEETPDAPEADRPDWDERRDADEDDSTVSQRVSQ